LTTVNRQNGRSDFEEVRRRNLLQRPRMIADAGCAPACSRARRGRPPAATAIRTSARYLRRVERVPGIQIIEHGEALFHAILDGDH
jgi:hypothetical protein